MGYVELKWNGPRIKFTHKNLVRWGRIRRANGERLQVYIFTELWNGEKTRYLCSVQAVSVDCAYAWLCLYARRGEHHDFDFYRSVPIG